MNTQESWTDLLKYTLKRLLMVIPVMIGVSIIVFALMRVFSPDPAPIVLGQHATQASMEQWRTKMGLNTPIVTQYVTYVEHAVRGWMSYCFTSSLPFWTWSAGASQATFGSRTMATWNRPNGCGQ